MIARVPSLVAGALAVASVAACAAVLGFEELTDVVVADDAQVSPDASPACASIALPERPAAVAGAEIGADYTFAMRTFIVSDPPDLNLDDTCTDVASRSSCVLPAPVGNNDPMYWLDKDRGVDEAANGLLAFAQTFFPALAQSSLSRSLEYGYFTALIQITKWNGTPDDDAVGVNVYASRGLEKAANEGHIERRVPDYRNPAETWVKSSTATTTGYVSGGRVAAFFGPQALVVFAPTRVPPSVPPPPPGTLLDPDAGALAVSARPQRIQMTEAYLLADLRPADETGPVRLDNGVVAARLLTKPFLDEAARLGDGTVTFKPYCLQKPAVVSLIRDNVCAAVDLRADLGDDGGLACNALSLAIGFRRFPRRSVRETWKTRSIRARRATRSSAAAASWTTPVRRQALPTQAPTDRRAQLRSCTLPMRTCRGP